MRFSNRFAALDEEGSVPAAAAVPVPAQAAAVAPSSAEAARVALSSNTSTYRPPHSIFRKGNGAADPSAPIAFQNMRGTPAEGSDWKYQRTPGYKGLFPNAAPPPKTYEEEYPTLGGGKAKAAAAAPAAASLKATPKSGYASLAKSWADKAAEETAAAEAAAAQAAKEAERRRYENERHSNLYSALAFRRNYAIQEDNNFDYNQEYVQNPSDSWDEPEDDCPPQQERSTTPPYYQCDFPDAHEPYDENQ